MCYHGFFFLMIRRPPRSTLDRSSAASDVYKRQGHSVAVGQPGFIEFGAGLDELGCLIGVHESRCKKNEVAVRRASYCPPLGGEPFISILTTELLSISRTN